MKSFRKVLKNFEKYLQGILREDGMLGLPGGTLEVGESLEDGLRRELKEEVKIEFPVGSHVIFKKHLNLAKEKNFVWVHYISLVEITEEQFLDVENRANSAEHFGTEVKQKFFKFSNR